MLLVYHFHSLHIFLLQSCSLVRLYSISIYLSIDLSQQSYTAVPVLYSCVRSIDVSPSMMRQAKAASLLHPGVLHNRVGWAGHEIRAHVLKSKQPPNLTFPDAVSD